LHATIRFLPLPYQRECAADRLTPPSGQPSARAFSAARARKGGSVLGTLVDAAEQPFGQGDVDPHPTLPHLRQSNQKDHGIGIRGVGHNRFQRVRGGQFFAFLDHSGDIKLERFLTQASRLVEGCPGGDAAREVAEIHAKIAVTILSDQTAP
jgi:hypothetical protein